MFDTSQLDECGNEKLCNFRVVCRSLNAVVEPKLFSRIIINIRHDRLDISRAQLQALSAGTTRASEFVRQLEIRSLQSLSRLDVTAPVRKGFFSRTLAGLKRKDAQELEDEGALATILQIKEDLGPALASLKNLIGVV